QDPCTRPRPRHRGRQALGAGAVRGRHPGGEGDPRLVCRARRQLRHRLPRVRRDLQRGLQVARRAAVHPADPRARPRPDRRALRGAERAADRPPARPDRHPGVRVIPRVFHAFWGGPPMPAHLAAYLRRWQELHPYWEFRLWTPDNLPRLRNQDLFDAPEIYSPKSNPWQWRSDLARYELLYDMGGVY